MTNLGKMVGFIWSVLDHLDSNPLFLLGAQP